MTDIKDGTHSSPKYQEKGYSLVTSKNLQNGHIDFSNTSKISEEDYDSINKRSLVESDDIIFGMIGTIGNPVLIKDGGFAIKNVALIKHSYKLDSYFVLNFLLSNSFIKHIEMNNEGGTQKFISLNNIRTCPLNIPSKDEQQKIGSFFAKLDQLIELQTQKLEQLKKLKRGFLQKMFPQDGESVPRLRFSGFTGEWKSGFLGDKCDITMGQSPNSKNYTNDSKQNILVQGNADISKGKIFPRIYTSEITKISKKSEIIMTVRAPVGELAVNQFDNVVIGRGVASLSGNVFDYFLLTRIKENGIWNRVSSGSTFDAVNASDIKSVKLYIPKNNEQQKIGGFFSKLDQLINNQSKKIEALKQQKKAYLQKTFI